MDLHTTLIIAYLALWIIIEIKHYFLNKQIDQNHEEQYKWIEENHEEQHRWIEEIQRKLISMDDYMAGQFIRISELNHTLNLQNAELKQQLENIAKELEMIRTGETKVLTV